MLYVQLKITKRKLKHYLNNIKAVSTKFDSLFLTPTKKQTIINKIGGDIMRDRLDYMTVGVRQAGERIRELIESHAKVEITTKEHDSDFVTNVDKQTEVYLVDHIKKRYDNQDFLTEEKTIERTKSDELWIIDPIDGTTNFIFQQKNFAISVAFYKAKKPVFGIVYDVMSDKMFIGVHGEGAYLNGVKLDNMNANKPLKNSILYGDLYSLTMFPSGIMDLRDKIVSHRYFGAASLEICAVAENQAQAYISRNLKVWDVAAAVIILNEVEGSYFFGGHNDDLYYHDADGVFISAQNKKIKEEIQELINSEVLEEIL